MAAELHFDGYEGAVEDACPVRTFHRAECELCDFRSEEFDELDWKSAEEEAVEHVEEMHAEDADDDEEEEEEDDDD